MCGRSQQWVSEEDERGTRVHLLALMLLVISAFGIYVTSAPGIRLDQIATYGILAWLLITNYRPAVNFRRGSAVSWLVLTYILMCTVIGVQSIGTFDATAMRSWQEAEAFTQTIALLIALSILVDSHSAARLKEMFEATVAIVLLCLCVNTILIIAQMHWDMWWLTRAFTGQYDLAREESRVWLRSANAGRYIGIFNQPFESGLAYGVGILLCMYRLVQENARLSTNLLIFVMIFVGAWISGSKVILFVAFPIAILLAAAWVIVLKDRRHWILRRAACVALCLAVLLPILVSQSEIGFMKSFFRMDYLSERSALELVSGGRFGKSDTTNVERHLSDAFADWEVGRGIPSRFAFDNAYLQIMAYGGIVALALYLVWLAIPAFVGIVKARESPGEASLLVSMVGLILGAGMGAPVLQINRVSILLCTVIVLLLACLGGQIPRRSEGPSRA